MRASKTCLAKSKASPLIVRKGEDLQEDLRASWGDLGTLGGDVLAEVGNTDRKPGLVVVVGSPFMVTMRAEESSRKKVSATPLKGPVGGLTWPRLNGRRASKGPRPQG
jgi:hypothetical protein